MPVINSAAAAVCIALQLLTLCVLLRKPYHYPAFTAFAALGLVPTVFWFTGWNAGWSFAAWLMVGFKLAVVAECLGLMAFWRDRAHYHVLAGVSLACCLALLAFASNAHTSLLYGARYITHAAAAGGCLVAWRLIPKGTHAREHCFTAFMYFLAYAITDINLFIFGAQYWKAHLALTAVQSGCWTVWLLAAIALPRAVASPRFARVSYPGA